MKARLKLFHLIIFPLSSILALTAVTPAQTATGAAGNFVDETEKTLAKPLTKSLKKLPAP